MFYITREGWRILIPETNVQSLIDTQSKYIYVALIQEITSWSCLHSFHYYESPKFLLTLYTFSVIEVIPEGGSWQIYYCSMTCKSLLHLALDLVSITACPTWWRCCKYCMRWRVNGPLESVQTEIKDLPTAQRKELGF